jgi:MFS transporter, DHA1 family, multidrug resistance protein
MAFIGASQLASGLGQRVGVLKLLKIASIGFALAACGLLALALADQVGLWTCIAGLAAGNACLGLIIPTAMVLALDDQGEKAGLASSLGGTLQMLTGGVLVVAMGPFLTSEPLPMIAGVALCAVTALVLMLMIRAPQAARA